jgi:hypothetical protein
VVRASQWGLIAASLLWLNMSNALDTVRIGISKEISCPTKRFRAAIVKKSLTWGSSTR